MKITTLKYAELSQTHKMELFGKKMVNDFQLLAIFSKA